MKLVDILKVAAITLVVALLACAAFYDLEPIEPEEPETLAGTLNPPGRRIPTRRPIPSRRLMNSTVGYIDAWENERY